MSEPYELKISGIKKIVLSSAKTPRKQFKRILSKEIKEFVQSIFDAYQHLGKTTKTWKTDEMRNFWVEKYLQNAIDNLLCATNHLISGYIIASGNLSRQFCESCAMAMIISNRKMKYYDKHFVQLDKKFQELNRCLTNKTDNYLTIFNEARDEMSKIQVNQSMQMVWDNRRHFDIDSDEWKGFTRVRNFYHELSHPSIYQFGKLLGTPKGIGKIVFGSYYNPEYKELYKREMKRKIEQAKILKNIVEGIKRQLNSL